MYDDPDSNKCEISYLDMYVAAHIKLKKRVDDLLNQVNAFLLCAWQFVSGDCMPYLATYYFWKTKFTLKNKFPSFFQKFSQSGENSHHQN